MCIVFIWQSDHHHGDSVGKYKFILASNRDEDYDRPTKGAAFWQDAADVLAGKDLKEGQSFGGTWLGMTKDGRIAFLTNLSTLNETVDLKKRGRGHLVADYLKSSVETSAHTYLQQIILVKDLYRPFHLVVGNVNDQLLYVTNDEQCRDQPKLFHQGCLTNCSIALPWLKQTNSEKKFKQLMEGMRSDDSRLHENLFTFLTSTEKNYPDPSPSSEWHTSSIFVEDLLCGSHSSSPKYGTRSSTVISVDQADHVVYHERVKTRRGQPVDEWTNNVYEFDLQKP